MKSSEVVEDKEINGNRKHFLVDSLIKQ
jgi:hypothetical protein